jgi:hypothetical protein
MVKKLQQIKLNKFFYSRRAIQLAAETTKEQLSVEVEETDKHYLVNIKSRADLDDPELKREFSNMCLIYTKTEINTAAFRI